MKVFIKCHYSPVHTSNKYLVKAYYESGTALGMQNTEAEGVQNMPLWHKNYFELKAFEFLKFLIYLRVEPPKRTKTELNCHKSPPWEQLISNTPNETLSQNYLPSILLRVHLSF